MYRGWTESGGWKDTQRRNLKGLSAVSVKKGDLRADGLYMEGAVSMEVRENERSERYRAKLPAMPLWWSENGFGIVLWLV
jgi:hypothetical protein